LYTDNKDWETQNQRFKFEQKTEGKWRKYAAFYRPCTRRHEILDCSSLLLEYMHTPSRIYTSLSTAQLYRHK